MNYGCEMDILPHCCGIYEAGDFCEYDGPIYTSIKGDTVEVILEKCLSQGEGRPIVFNFVKPAICKTDEWGDERETGEFEDVYECETFRQLVKAHKNVIDIGTHINPRTHNKIHTYIIKDYI